MRDMNITSKTNDIKVKLIMPDEEEVSLGKYGETRIVYLDKGSDSFVLMASEFKDDEEEVEKENE